MNNEKDLKCVEISKLKCVGISDEETINTLQKENHFLREELSKYKRIEVAFGGALSNLCEVIRIKGELNNE